MGSEYVTLYLDDPVPIEEAHADRLVERGYVVKIRKGLYEYLPEVFFAELLDDSEAEDHG